jgi:hypothetical protein
MMPGAEAAVADEPVVSLDPATEPIFHYISGVAGTGKTTLIQNRVAEYDDALLMATTGIAAVNLGEGVTTINSNLMFFDTNDLRSAYEVGRLGAFLKRFYGSGYHRLIVDEVSMMDGEQLTILVTCIEGLNEWYLANHYDPLGLTIVGDFFQLPPVNAPFVFESPVWDRFESNTIKLKKIWRQTDPAFLRALHAVRCGDGKAALDYFAPRLSRSQESQWDGTTIFAKNDEVDRHNKLRMLQLLAPADTFPTEREGKQSGEWKHIPDTLVLKPGCLVMALANRRWPKGPDDVGPMPLMYANGDLGHYLGKANDRQARVRLMRNGEEVDVIQAVKEKSTATGNKGVKAPRTEVEGSVRYMPLRVAYASTCHKTQSLTLDRVQVVYHSQFWSQPGMLYTALSRCRTPGGLRLVGTEQQFAMRCRSNPKLGRWA